MGPDIEQADAMSVADGSALVHACYQGRRIMVRTQSVRAAPPGEATLMKTARGMTLIMRERLRNRTARVNGFPQNIQC
jgi:hypothetical protein